MNRVMSCLLMLSVQALADVKPERLWKSKCQSCHGADGKAQTEKGKKMQVLDLSSSTFQAKRTDADLMRAIREGTSRTENGVKKEMDAYPDLSEEQLKALVGFLRSLKP